MSDTPSNPVTMPAISRPSGSLSYPPPPRNHHIPPIPHIQGLKEEPGSNHRLSISSDVDLGDGASVYDEDEDEVHSLGRKEKKPHATRRRVVNSCSECRRRKIKCDKKLPCGPCVLRSDQARCHEVGIAEKHIISNLSNCATTSDLALLAHRLDALESSLVKSGSLLPADLEHYLKITHADVSGFENPHQLTRNDVETVSTVPPPLIQSETVDDTEGAALTLEYLAFGRSRVEGSHSLPHFGGRLPSTVSKHAPNNDYHLTRTGVAISPTTADLVTGGSMEVIRRPSGAGADGRPSIMPPDERDARVDALLDLIGPTDIFDLFYKRTDVALRALTKVLPSRERGELLVRAYLEKVDWLHRCLHIPTFMRQCNDVWSLPTEMVVHEIALPFLALYFTVLSLGLQFMDSSEIAKHFTPEEAQSLPELWFSASRSASWAGDFFGSHTMEALQNMILIGVLLNNKDRSEAAWALLGAGIKMAQGLGLSRLGAEQQSVDGKPLPMWTGRWESLIQREVGRRIWWNLVFLDWALAPSYNFSSSIQPDQIKTALPANIEDEDLIDGEPLRAQPLNVRTGMSFQLARLKFAEITHRQIWQANNDSHPPYSFILSVDGELRKGMMELPAFFQPDPGVRGPPSQDPKSLVQYYEKIMLTLAIHSRMLRLHRPWLSRGYEDERFSYSKEQCIRAARATLRMMSDSDGTASFLEKWWIPLFYVAVSGLVVIIDLLRMARRTMRSNETEQKIAEVRGALDQMRRIADVSHPSKGAVKVMDFLLAEVEERRKPGSSRGKRKASGSPAGDDDEESGLQRAVKKLIRQAQLEADSPVHSVRSGSASSGSTPHQGRMDMRIFSDTPRDRPVFDAYPMPTHAQQVNAANMLQVAPTQPNPTSTSPFTFPVDTTSATNFPNFASGAGFPQLDPAVESILLNYFPSGTGGQPQQGMGGPVGTTQVPDDFVSRVFNFGWEGGNSGQGGVPQNGGQQVQGQDGFDLPGYEGWGAHGWMA